MVRLLGTTGPLPAPENPFAAGPQLTVAGLNGPRDAVTIIDAGQAAAGTLPEDGRRYAVVRGPCYLALATLASLPDLRPDGVILVAEPGRSLSAADTSAILGVPIVATVPVRASIARLIDAGLLAGRPSEIPGLDCLIDPLMARAEPAANAPSRWTNPGRPLPGPERHRPRCDRPLGPRAVTPSIGASGVVSSIVPLKGRLDAARWLSARTSVEVIAIRHSVVETLGHQPTSDYAEQFWLPVIGPSALWAHRRLTAGLASDRSSYVLDLATLDREIGLGAGTGRNSLVVRTLARLVDFHLAEIVNDRLGVYTSLPPLTRRQAARLPDHLTERHRALTTRHHDTSPYVAGLGVEVGR